MKREFKAFHNKLPDCKCVCCGEQIPKDKTGLFLTKTGAIMCGACACGVFESIQKGAEEALQKIRENTQKSGVSSCNT